MSKREAVIVIPSRLGSVRLPRKPLLRESGKYLVEHVVERARASRLQSRVVVATDSTEIEDALSPLGIEVVMTSADHPSGSDRVREAVSLLDTEYEVVLNLQGDEPETEPEVLDDVIASCDEDHPMVTCATRITEESMFEDPAQVKVVMNERDEALYFSRAPIPYRKQGGGLHDGAWLHLGLYAYTPDTLVRFTELPPSPLERVEGLEQLRALENGIPILVRKVQSGGGGVDTRADYDAFLRRERERAERTHPERTQS